MVWKFCEFWKSYGKWGPEGLKFCEILSHSVRYGMYALTYRGTQRKNPDTQFNEKWMGKNSPKYPIA